MDYSKAAKRRRKKAGGKRAMFQRLEKVQEAVREAEAFTAACEDPRTVVQDARSRMMARKSTPALLAPMLCEPTGRALDIGAGKRDAEVLWAVFKQYDQAEHSYFLRVIGRPRFPNVAKMEHMPSSLETRPDDKPDLRDAATKDRDAANTWMRFEGYLGQMPAFQAKALRRAAWHMEELHKGADLTVAGETFVAAVRSLADIVERG